MKTVGWGLCNYSVYRKRLKKEGRGDLGLKEWAMSLFHNAWETNADLSGSWLLLLSLLSFLSFSLQSSRILFCLTIFFLLLLIDLLSLPSFFLHPFFLYIGQKVVPNIHIWIEKIVLSQNIGMLDNKNHKSIIKLVVLFQITFKQQSSNITVKR